MVAAGQSQTLTLPPGLRGKVLIFVVAYEAERHIASVFDRIPTEFWNDPDYHLLMIDDASKDLCSAVAVEWAESHGVRNITVLRNPVNQGYGGNQKLGYRIAIEAGFEYVIMLHGDGQYAPEMLPRFVQAWREEQADVALGTRMHSIKSARKGGMQWYKIAGNRVLTWFQNKVTGQKLSEYHTGYRAYSTRFLKSVPFEVNTNNFHFDTEILLQSFYVGAKTVEFPIPTFYGDEICRVPGLKYARDVFFATIQYAAHKRGLLCSLRYRHLAPLRYRDKSSALYTSHSMALAELDRQPVSTLLDIGCGPGYIARRCEDKGIRVTGVDVFDPLPGKMTEFHASDLERDGVPADIFDFDAVLLLDVIEHLADPERFLLDLRNRSEARIGTRAAPLMIISTPNIAFAAIRLNLLLGRFSYAERGILDITHKRLFTKRALLTTLKNCGYVIERYRPVPVPFEAVMSPRIGRVLGGISNLLARVWPSMFSFQSLVTCRPLPGVHQLVFQTITHSAAGAVANAAERDETPYTPSSVAAATSSDEAANV